MRPRIFWTKGRRFQSWSVISRECCLSSSKMRVCAATKLWSSTFRFASSFNDMERLSRLAEPTEAQQSSTRRYLQWKRAGWYS